MFRVVYLSLSLGALLCGVSGCARERVDVTRQVSFEKREMIARRVLQSATWDLASCEQYGQFSAHRALLTGDACVGPCSELAQQPSRRLIFVFGVVSYCYLRDYVSRFRWLPPHVSRFAPYLSSALETADVPVVAAAGGALNLDYIFRSTRSDDPSKRAGAFNGLAALSAVAENTSQIRERVEAGLKDPQADVRFGAMMAVVEFDFEDAAPMVARSLSESRPVRGLASLVHQDAGRYGTDTKTYPLKVFAASCITLLVDEDFGFDSFDGSAAQIDSVVERAQEYAKTQGWLKQSGEQQ